MKHVADDISRAAQEIKDRRKRICCAVFAHACIAIEKLPAGYNFWSEFYDKYGKENVQSWLQELELLSRSPKNG
jgi:hypothetical protein